MEYISGFRNHCESEAVAGALTHGRNAPQKVPFNLYTEQLNGTAFTTPRADNLFTWMYRIRPSVTHSAFRLVNQPQLVSAPFESTFTPPTQMRWDPLPYPSSADFLHGLVTFAGNGSVEMHEGAAIHLYAITESMQNDYFYNADGEMLFVPQEGIIQFKTELGIIDVAPGEIVVIPRGIKFQVCLHDKKARGYICENYGQPFRLPDLGVIGANGLANPRDFKKPVASFEEKEGDFKLYAKFQGKLWVADMDHSPLDVVAWHGNLTPYKYDLSLFNAMNTVSYDHPDPSIFTVLTSPSATHGTANVDFVIFPPRWMVASNTFRPPYFHRNVMSEYMGLIHGKYDAKETGFVPGGASLHNCMSAHGPDAQAYNKAVNASLQPEYYADILAFMFESKQVWRLTEFAFDAPFRQHDYLTCWEGLENHFNEKSTA